MAEESRRVDRIGGAMIMQIEEVLTYTISPFCGRWVVTRRGKLLPISFDHYGDAWQFVELAGGTLQGG